MFDTADDSDNLAFDELVTSIESNTNRFSAGEICARESLIDYEHLRRVFPITMVEQTSLLQFDSGGLKERRRHHAVIGDSLVGLRQRRFTCDPKCLPHRASAERQVRYRANRSHTGQRAQRLQCLMKKLCSARTAVRIIAKAQRESGG